MLHTRSSPLHAPPYNHPFTNRSVRFASRALLRPTDRGSGAPVRFTERRELSSRTITSGTDAFLRPRVPFKLAAFNVRTLARIGQQAALARTLESLAIDVCCVSETRIYDSSSVTRLSSPSGSSCGYCLRLSGDDEAAASGQAGVGIVLSNKAETALLDWIPINSRLCAVRLKDRAGVAACGRKQGTCL